MFSTVTYKMEGSENTSLFYTYGILLGFLVILYLFLQGNFF